MLKKLKENRGIAIPFTIPNIDREVELVEPYNLSDLGISISSNAFNIVCIYALNAIGMDILIIFENGNRLFLYCTGKEICLFSNMYNIYKNMIRLR